MDEKLVQAIIKALTSQGNTKLVNLFKLKGEDEIEDAISGLKTDKPTFLELIKDKEYQKEFDKTIAKALNTREEKLKEKFNFVKKEGSSSDSDDDHQDKGGDSGDSKLEKEMAKLQALVLKQEAQRNLEKSTEEAKKLLKDNSIPTKFIKFFNFNDESKSLTEQFEDIKTDFSELKSSITEDLGVHSQFPLPNVKGVGKPNQDEIEGIVDNL